MRIIEFVLIRYTVPNKNHNEKNVPNKNISYKIHRKKSFLVNGLFYSSNKKFRYISLTKNVLRHLIPLNLKVQIFSICNNKVIALLKITRLFLLGSLFLIRTVSEKMFLIRTFHIIYIEKNYFLINYVFSCFKFKISIFFC